MSKIIPAVELSDVFFAYNDMPVLINVNIRINEREYICIVGPNGGGKTTLLKIIIGLLRPTRGIVKVLGKSPDRARGLIGYMPQHAQVDYQFPISVKEVVQTGLLRGGGGLHGYGKDSRAEVMKALEEVGMSEFSQRAFSDLSGGQRQRVLIARAVVSRPRLLLLDEPTSNMDIAAERDFYSLLGKLNERMTLVMVSHNPWVVSKTVKNVVCVKGSCTIHHTEESTDYNEAFGSGFKMVRHDHDECSGRENND